MHIPRCRTVLPLLALLTAVIGFLPGARAEEYPNRPVRLITDSAPGSAIDVPVRLIAEGLSRIWGQQAVVVNQPGAGGAIAARSGATAAPDGYTFGVMALSAFVALPGTADNLPVQVPRDAIPVGYLGGAPMFIGSAPWLGIKTLPDLWPVSGLSQDSSGFFSGNDLYDKCTAESHCREPCVCCLCGGHGRRACTRWHGVFAASIHKATRGRGHGLPSRTPRVAHLLRSISRRCSF